MTSQEFSKGAGPSKITNYFQRDTSGSACFAMPTIWMMSSSFHVALSTKADANSPS
jgi:hypothetical protein